MSTPIKFELSPDSNIAFAQATDFAQEHLRMSGPKILDWAAYNYIRSARKHTKSARKNAKRMVARLTARRNQWPRFGVIKYSQRRGPETLPIYDRNAKTRRDVKSLQIARVPNIGAAKGSWWSAMSDLGKWNGGKKGPSVSRAKSMPSKDHPAIELTNRLSYLLKIAPDVDVVAKRKAAKQLIIRSERAIARAWK